MSENKQVLAQIKSESKHTIYESRASTHADDCWSWGPGHYKCAVGMIERLRTENARLREDAERYRWLRDPCSGAERVIFYCRGDYGRGLMSGSWLDAAIDDAMGKEASND